MFVQTKVIQYNFDWRRQALPGFPKMDFFFTKIIYHAFKFTKVVYIYIYILKKNIRGVSKMLKN